MQACGQPPFELLEPTVSIFQYLMLLDIVLSLYRAFYVSSVLTILDTWISLG